MRSNLIRYDVSLEALASGPALGWNRSASRAIIAQG
jgi:hypothetical protein